MNIGVDLGGTKIEAVALDSAGAERARLRVPTPRGDYHGTVAAIRDLVLGIEGKLGARATVGVGTPGAVSPATGLMKNCNSTWLNGTALDRDLAAALERRVRLANDADCFALSEAIDGAGEGAGVVFGVIVGTGTGGGIVVDGKLLSGPNAIAGEWGHNPLPWPVGRESPGEPCYCSRTGCIETFLSGPGMSRDHLEASGARLSAAEIVRGAEDGDREAAATITRYAERMGRALASVINIIDPDVIVLGGGMSNLPGLVERVPELWRPWVFSDRVDTRLVKARHGDSSGVRGAARLWDRGLGRLAAP